MRGWLCAENSDRQKLGPPTNFWENVTTENQKRNTLGGDRTLDLHLRRVTRYPLRYKGFFFQRLFEPEFGIRSGPEDPLRAPMPGQRGQRGFEFFGYINPSIRLLLQFLTLQQGLLGSLPGVCLD